MCLVNLLLLQIELDNTAMAFRQAHTEREELIQQWEHTIDQMKRRDADMDRCATVSPSPIYPLWHNLLSAIFQELAQLRAEIRTKNDAIREKQVNKYYCEAGKLTAFIRLAACSHI